jgi:hypothetical protein
MDLHPAVGVALVILTVLILFLAGRSSWKEKQEPDGEYEIPPDQKIKKPRTH